LVSREISAFVEKVPRPCILRDLSFAGAKLIIMGVAKFLEDREASLRVEFEDPRVSFLLKGKFGKLELVEGRKDLVAVFLSFDEAQIPMGYKLRINDYLNQTKIEGRSGEGARGGKDPGAASPVDTSLHD
jgi:hypothetical protein